MGYVIPKSVDQTLFNRPWACTQPLQDLMFSEEREKRIATCWVGSVQ